jgi:hypothetical protein
MGQYSTRSLANAGAGSSTDWWARFLRPRGMLQPDYKGIRGIRKVFC